MLDLKFLINNPYFEEVTLEKLEVLFDEGDKDENLYIIKKGSLSVEKYTTIEKKESKQLAILKENDIFGEGALNGNKAKEVKIIAIEETILLKINAKKGIHNFLKENTIEGIKLLTNIIDISNKRVLESNYLVISNYQISKHISEITKFNNKNLFLIIEEFKKVLGVDYLIYIEKNPIIKDYSIIKYDTRKKGKMQNTVIEIKKNKINFQVLKENNISIIGNEYIENLKNKNFIVGYLVIGYNNYDNQISELQKKAISSISTLIAGVIIQKQNYEEEQNIEYIEEE